MNFSCRMSHCRIYLNVMLLQTCSSRTYEQFKFMNDNDSLTEDDDHVSKAQKELDNLKINTNVFSTVFEIILFIQISKYLCTPKNPQHI